MISRVTLELLETLDVFLALAPPGKPTLNTPTRGDATPHSTESLLHISKQRPPETVEEVRKLTSALDVLSPDVQRGNGQLFEPGDTHPSENYWLLVVWSIASLGWECGKDIARFWSQRSERYSDEGFEAAWNAYDSTRPRAIGIGSLFKLARERGWKDDSLNPVTLTESSHYRVLTPSDVRELQALSWRIKGILPEKGIAAIYGPPGSGKSFLVTDLAAAISRGEAWFGHKTKQAPVVFLMLEGEAGVRNRIEAFEKTKGALPNCFGIIVQPFEFLSGQDITNLKTVVPKGSVVVVDTLNRAAPTADENHSADMGRILAAAKALQSETDGLVLIVHHTGKDSSKGLRGHSSLLAALDASIEVERHANQRSWRLAKSKDGADGISVAFKLETVPLGVDSDGDEISSCVVLPDVSAILTKTEPRGAQQRSALQRLKSLLSGGQLTTTGCGGAPPSTACMPIEDAVTAVAFGLTATPPNKRRNEARRIVKALITSEHLCSGLDSAGVAWCWV